MENNLKSKCCEKLFWLFMLSLCFGNIYIDVGFAIKPYMIVSLIVILFIILFKFRSVPRLKSYEICYLIFVSYCIFSCAFFENNELIIRYILGIIVMSSVYILLRIILKEIKKEKILEIINSVGMIFCIITLIYYFMGLFTLNFNFSGNGIMEYGVLIDRNIPRIISLASSDPNITGFIMTIFAFTFLRNIKKIKNKIGFILSIIIALLTFSRGAIIAYCFAILISFILYSKLNLKKIIFGIIKVGIVFFILFTIINYITNNEIIEILEKRFSNTISDGGSGRLALWSLSISNFLSNPLFGIGLNNSQLYTDGVHIHNTILEVLSETGMIGFLLYFIYLMQILFTSIKVYKKDNKNYIFVSIVICMYIQMFFLSILLQESFFAFLAILTRFLYDDIINYGKKILKN